MVDWSRFGREARAMTGTPCFLFSERVVCDRLAWLQRFDSNVPLRHWLSLKTQPIARLIAAALDWGMGVEIASDFELAAVLSSHVPSDRILINGIGKWDWLRHHHVSGCIVHFDSLAEVHAHADRARELAWTVGLRCAVPRRYGSTVMTEWDQFGMSAEELRLAVQRLSAAGVIVSGVHFHLHTNVEYAAEYRRAAEFVQSACECARLEPRYIDIGGGLPLSGERPMGGTHAARTFDFAEFADVMRSIPAMFSRVTELWLENGRFVTGAAGALTITVVDKKERDGRTYLICDGGRTNHARLATTEVHDIIVEPHREGPLRETVVCGPTCGVVDRLGSWMLPESIVPGDLIIWLNAGAYHIPLETRFSFGLAPVVWFDAANRPELVRERETPGQWWSQWTAQPWRIADAVSR